jgi:hypothetical protein
MLPLPAAEFVWNLRKILVFVRLKVSKVVVQ